MRRRKDPLQAVCELDAFPKVADTYKQTSTMGGTSTYDLILAVPELQLLSTNIGCLQFPSSAFFWYFRWFTPKPEISCIPGPNSISPLMMNSTVKWI